MIFLFYPTAAEPVFGAGKLSHRGFPPAVETSRGPVGQQQY